MATDWLQPFRGAGCCAVAEGRGAGSAGHQGRPAGAQSPRPAGPDGGLMAPHGDGFLHRGSRRMWLRHKSGVSIRWQRCALRPPLGSGTDASLQRAVLFVANFLLSPRVYISTQRIATVCRQSVLLPTDQISRAASMQCRASASRHSRKINRIKRSCGRRCTMICGPNFISWDVRSVVGSHYGTFVFQLLYINLHPLPSLRAVHI